MDWLQAVVGLSVALGLFSGFTGDRLGRRQQVAGRDLDGESLSWRQGYVAPWREDRFAVFVTIDHFLLGPLFLGTLLALMLKEPRPWLVLLALAVFLPALTTGQLLGKYYYQASTERWITLRPSGLFTLGLTVPWASISHVEADRSHGLIKVFANTDARAVLDVLRPPDQASFESEERMFAAHLPQLAARERDLWRHGRARATQRMLGVMLAKPIIVLLPALLADAKVAVAIIGSAAWLMARLTLHVVERLIGVEVARSGTAAGSAG